MDFFQVINDCNKFDFAAERRNLYMFSSTKTPQALGYMRREYVDQMTWDKNFLVVTSDRTVQFCPESLNGKTYQQAWDESFLRLCEANADKMPGVKKWLALGGEKRKGEYHPVLGLEDKDALSVPSILRGIVGIPTAGAHMTMYTRKDGQTYVWVAKRSRNVTFPGKLDQLVAGALAPGDGKDPFNTMKREAMEEAGLDVNATTRKVTANGKVVGEIQPLGKYSFYHQKDESAGTESGHLEPGIRFNYKLEVPADFIPTICEPQSIEGFYCKSLDDIRASLCRGDWKANSALAMIHFLVEDGHISPNEGALAELKAALKDKIPSCFELHDLQNAGISSRCLDNNTTHVPLCTVKKLFPFNSSS